MKPRCLVIGGLTKNFSRNLLIRIARIFRFQVRWWCACLNIAFKVYRFIHYIMNSLHKCERELSAPWISADGRDEVLKRRNTRRSTRKNRPPSPATSCSSSVPISSQILSFCFPNLFESVSEWFMKMA